ncbi:MAG: 4'-phosphopantetheinyl transferase superfamily protein [Actinomycetia bacterium]|nr:4'-phosphopantetheinyl transferase superfamily protein [Actinomycetes bacterium]
MDNQDIAIVGISIASPAGNNAEEFWEGIVNGGDFITEVPANVIDPYYFQPPANGLDHLYFNRGGFLNPVKVDPLRYGIMPITASGTDPEQLASLLSVDHALIDAGVTQKGLSLEHCSLIIGRGSFGGIVPTRTIDIMRSAVQFAYMMKSVMPDLTDQDMEEIKSVYRAYQGRYAADMATGSMPNLIASLVANRFDMRGPAYMVDAACSSGIVAINNSISLLRSGQCDMAVAGGMHLSHSAMFWGIFDMMGAASRKQVIAPFSADADGLLIGQGSGFVVLKTLERALRDEDRIYAVIKETSVCSDGGGTHVMVTSVDGQINLYKQTWERSGMDPEKVSYIEAHGTGTPVGDRTELASLKSFFGDKSHARAYVGSVKSNIGHTMPAAGMIGVIKTALALYWRKIPPTLHCENPQPEMFETRFLPPQEAIDWDGEELPLVAGVNAFGFGGINAHAILTAYEPQTKHLNQRPKPRIEEALMLSAKSKEALIAKLKNEDFTNTGGDWRLVLFLPNKERIDQAIAVVEKGEPCRGKGDIWFSNRPMLKDGGKIAFLFPGYWGEWESETDSISDMFDLPRMEELMAKMRREDASKRPSHLAIQYVYNSKLLSAMALEKLGVQGDLYAGYSIGEWDAALFAGITQGNTEALASGLSEWDEFERFPVVTVSGLSRQAADAICAKIPDLWLSCDNSPSQMMFCGTYEAAEKLKAVLNQGHIYHTVLHRIGIHTPLASEITWEHQAFSPEDISIQEGRVPVWSSTSLELLPTEKDEYLKFFIEEQTKTVNFQQLINKLYDEQQVRIFIQIGLGPLEAFVEDTLQGKDFAAMTTIVLARQGKYRHNSLNQLRRIMALMFIEGRENVDAEFIGAELMYRTEHSVIGLPTGLPSLVENMPELAEIVKKRYGTLSPGAIAAGVQPSTASDPVGQAVDTNIQEAITAQQQLAKLFERRQQLRDAVEDGQALPVPVGAAPAVAAAAAGAATPPPLAAPAPVAAVPVAAGAPVPVAASAGHEPFEEVLHLRLEDHPYLIDHSIVRQPKDWPFVEDLNPVVPFAMTIELFAELAMKRMPGRKLVRFTNLTATKWITLDHPLDLKVTGKWLDANTISMDMNGHATADCVFADEWPQTPPEYIGDIDVGKEIAPHVPVPVLYDKFSFHGPLYHSLMRQSKICERGMVGFVESKPGKGSLLDIMGQQLGLFLHLTQTENTISFPIRLGELEFYDDIFDQGGEFGATSIIKRLTNTMITGDIVLRRGDKVWCVAKNFFAQRFQNIRALWDVILHPEANLLAEQIAPGVYFVENDSAENVAALIAKRYLGKVDMAAFEAVESLRGKREYLVSRVALKDAVRAYVADSDGQLPYPIEFYCDHDERGKPSVHAYGWLSEKVGPLCVSLAHKNSAGLAMVSDQPVGVDLELAEAKPDTFIDSAFTQKEIDLMRQGTDPDAPVRFWVAKEAYAKKTGEGLAGNPKRFEVSEVQGDVLVVEGTRVQTRKVGAQANLIAGWTL